MMILHRFVFSLSVLAASLAAYVSPAFAVRDGFCVKCIYDCPASQSERATICEALCQGEFGAAVCSTGSGCTDPPTTIVCEMNPE